MGAWPRHFGSVFSSLSVLRWCSRACPLKLLIRVSLEHAARQIAVVGTTENFVCTRLLRSLLLFPVLPGRASTPDRPRVGYKRENWEMVVLAIPAVHRDDTRRC